MNFFDKWFLKQTKKAWENANSDISTGEKASRSHLNPRDDLLIRHPSNIIKMYKAIGGVIVEISSYNINLDKTFSELYVISDENKINDELISILMQHSLKHM